MESLKMANMVIDSEIDWMACELIEQILARSLEGPSYAEPASYPRPLLAVTISEKRSTNCARVSLPCLSLKFNV